MGKELDRHSLTEMPEIGRQVKLGGAIEDARPRIDDRADAAARLRAFGYRGTVEQSLRVDSRFPVTVPEGTRGIVVDSYDPLADATPVAFVWKTPKSQKVTAAIVYVRADQLVNHRGAPPLPGEPVGGASAAPTAAPTTTPPMLATLTAPTTPAAPSAGILETALMAVIGQQVEGRLAALEERLSAIPPQGAAYHIRINNADPVQLSHRPHAQFAHVMARASMRKHDGTRWNLFLTGDAGTGKSTIARDIALAMGLPFRAVNCSGGLTEGALVGRMTPNLTTGAMHYTPGPLVSAFRDGGVFLLDELDAADENVLLALNSMIDSDIWHTPEGEEVTRHESFVLMGAGNTVGTGANRLYSGRNQLDAAFLNRWLKVSVDYDTELELSLVQTREVAERIQRARVTLRARNLRRWLTTRDILKVDCLVNQLGLTVDAAFREITEDWTAEDRAVLGIS